MHLEGTIGFNIGQLSLAGCKKENEDCIGIRIPDNKLAITKGAIAVIADGVSTAEAGKEASATCVQNFIEDYFSTPEAWSVQHAAQKVLTALNRWLYSQGRHLVDSHRGYVSTMSAVIFKSHLAHLFHVGDSRIYRLRGNELEQLSRDHTREIARDKKYLARAMGLELRLDIDYQCVHLKLGDTFMLSTDGIHDFVSDQQIKAILQQHRDDLEAGCQALVDTAIEQNSDDNLSCQILQLTSLPLANIDDLHQQLTQLPFPPYLKKGVQIDGYRIERTLHTSQRSQLYLVTDISSGQRYTMKTPSANFDDDAAYIERFIMESWIGKRLHNPYIAKVIDPLREPTFLYNLTEFVDGLSLRQWMDEHPKADITEAIFLIEQIIKGIRAMHRREIIHQDIKPDNIMIDKHGMVKIIDFGACWSAGVAEVSLPIERDIALGTATYSAPECHLNQQGSSVSDQYSIAALLYEILTDEYPYQGKLENCHDANMLAKLRYIPSYQLNPLVPVWMDGAIQKALSINPSDRYREVSEFLYDLKKPNGEFQPERNTPLLQQRSEHFWRNVAIILFCSQLITGYILMT